MKPTTLWRKFFALLLVSLIASPGTPNLFSQATGQRAGEVAASIPVGEIGRNGDTMPTNVNAEIQWNDRVTTEARGRARLGLDDGSTLNVGSNSSLTVVQHNAASQETDLTLTFGQMRARTRLQQPGGRFEVRTNTAVIGVIGTDFWVEATATMTRVIVFEGAVEVRSLGGSQRRRRVGAGMWVTVASDQDPTAPSPPSEEDYHAAIADTEIGEALPIPEGPRKRWTKRPLPWILMAGAAVAIIVIAIVATDDSSSNNSSNNTSSP
jgi:hypothetical protein